MSDARWILTQDSFRKIGANGMTLVEEGNLSAQVDANGCTAAAGWGMRTYDTTGTITFSTLPVTVGGLGGA